MPLKKQQVINNIIMVQYQTWDQLLDILALGEILGMMKEPLTSMRNK